VLACKGLLETGVNLSSRAWNGNEPARWPWDGTQCHRLSQTPFMAARIKIGIPSEAVNNEEQLTGWARPQFHSCRLLCRSCKRYPAYLLQLHSGLEGPHRGSFRGLQATVYGTVKIKIQK
jgi:hypothetical protein